MDSGLTPIRNGLELKPSLLGLVSPLCLLMVESYGDAAGEHTTSGLGSRNPRFPQGFCPKRHANFLGRIIGPADIAVLRCQ